MNKNALKITTGAMVTAIFGVLLLLNRQTGSLFEEVFVFLYPIPMVAYAALYGVKNGIPVFAAMSLISVLFGNFSTIFYAVTQALIGLVFGGCLYHRIDMTKTLFAVMALSAGVNVLNTIVLGFLFGVDLNQEVVELQTMMNTVFQQAGVAVPENILSVNYLKQIFVISMTLMGILQGFVVYEVSLLVLRRLRFPVQKPKSVFLYYPPKWTGYLALLAILGYSVRMAQPFEQEMLQNTVMTVGMLGYLYLICFGFIGILLFFKVSFPRLRAFGAVISILGLFLFPFAEMIAGFLYIVSGYHLALVEKGSWR
ncbi:MAG: DUF2232 domain-containing protein [Eubacteriales bacterium]|nr:DUF2232 domain-containing protein [Eubacteriales bacterium]